MNNFLHNLDCSARGRSMHDLIARLYPIPRSITGPGIRETLDVIGERLDLERTRVASGEPAFDWTVPNEWTIREAWIKDPNGNTVVDFRDSSLHVVGYSTPVTTTLPLSALKEHIFTLPDHPDWVPFRASYYQEAWGFCMSHQQLSALPDGDYQVHIDSTLAPGYLDYGEFVIPGEVEDEVLISTHICHPALCNDNLSGIALAVELASHLREYKPRLTYRFLFIPTIIGSIVWLSRNESRAQHIRAGLISACVGDRGNFTYKKSRAGNAQVDRAALHALSAMGKTYDVLDFIPYGYDERNYSSPGFKLEIGSLSRSRHGTFPEYHTSADNLEFVTAEAMAESLEAYIRILSILDNDATLINMNPKCEPQLGKRGLYNVIGGLKGDQHEELAMFWLLNFSDGSHTLLDIAERSEIDFEVLQRVAQTLIEHELLSVAPGTP